MTVAQWENVQVDSITLKPWALVTINQCLHSEARELRKKLVAKGKKELSEETLLKLIKDCEQLIHVFSALGADQDAKIVISVVKDNKP